MIKIGLYVKAAVCFFVLSLLSPCDQTPAAGPATSISMLTAKIPVRRHEAMTGSAFVEHVAGMTGAQREQAVVRQLLRGNIPGFLRKLKPVHLQCRTGDGTRLEATIFVMPDYLAIGSNQDFIRFPMNHFSATTVARRFGFILPTRKMVDAIYAQADFRLRPKPMKPGPQMSSTGYYRTHNLGINRQCQAQGIVYGELLSGHKKDVVLTNRLSCDPKRVAIYGWHRREGAPIQPLSTVHGAAYADYSHGTRLISDRVVLNGRIHSVYDILKNPALVNVLSDEGCIHDALEIMRSAPLPSTAEKSVYTLKPG